MMRRGLMVRVRFLAGVFVSSLVPIAVLPAAAEILNPPVLQDDRAPIAKPALTELAPAASLPGNTLPVRGDRLLNLKIEYIDNQIYNLSTGGYDKVHLRGYTGKGVDPKAPYVSPTIEAVPGDTVRVTLDNQLPAGPQPGDPGCMPGGQMPDIPHCFNGTNLHTHGLWVSPSGNSDNVLLSINPQTQFTYEYNIPSDHPSGTFWYHTHRHGSTALQVSSGMAGALIIRGNRLPTPTTHGDIDTLIPTSAIPERVLVMQQIQYACRAPAAKPGELGPIKQDINGHYFCDPGDAGGIEGYDQFGPGTWPASGRYTSLNGKVFNSNDPLKATQGQVERWRMVHAGVRDTISLQFFKVLDGKLKPGVKTLLNADTNAAFIKDTCSTTPVPYTLVAADGLTMAAAQPTKLATFQPGYRFDALVVFPEAGRYCVIDSSAPKSGVVSGLDVGPQLLALVDVAPGTAVDNVETYVNRKLVALAEANMPANVKATVVADLKAGMKFTSFTPHPDVTDDEVKGNGTQELTFFIDTTGPNTKFEVGNTLNTADVKPYDPTRIDRSLPLGKAQEWTLQSHFVSHPFHIHVNPFQIVSIIDPNGKDVSAQGAIDDAGGEPYDPQYAGLKGVWKDTLWIKSLIPQSLPAGFSGIYTIKVRTRYERYIGEYVLHCHILDHEDQGMMQNVAVVLPDQVGDITQSGAMQMQMDGHDGHK
ncbi:L-ascorbate oxidase [Mesorhizobium sp. USDA 4775]|uniref:multicopper oxidase family protein n=1 Tax=Mesorhizobium jarvisii TaxID=1777867 RepID=UPI00056DA8E3|nr:multicopper oxidase domain-containing protein [Mesorhizobium jarvisii]MCH4561181.1 multicopper oxidase domain-containing protein [Mesorhizobium jarvisii]QGU21146.1 multicopper oxidase domain-containing protein [Mesorhizobium huakuii 7653R]